MYIIHCLHRVMELSATTNCHLKLSGVREASAGTAEDSLIPIDGTACPINMLALHRQKLFLRKVITRGGGQGGEKGASYSAYSLLVLSKVLRIIQFQIRI